MFELVACHIALIIFQSCLHGRPSFESGRRRGSGSRWVERHCVPSSSCKGNRIATMGSLQMAARREGRREGRGSDDERNGCSAAASIARMERVASMPKRHARPVSRARTPGREATAGALLVELGGSWNVSRGSSAGAAMIESGDDPRVVASLSCGPLTIAFDYFRTDVFVFRSTKLS